MYVYFVSKFIYFYFLNYVFFKALDYVLCEVCEKLNQSFKTLPIPTDVNV